ncbi:uncharacterized protein LOC143244038 [Tachypleus tridentatus]|uniref:uncharacterized protein LOC143244038 n=1 Tax=Tachypleus tridentatus TaxID=6853 RepID=UPI003FCF11BA
MKKYNQDEGPTLKSGFTKLSDTSDNWQPVSCGEITKKPSIIVCCSSNKEHKLGLEYESTVSNNNINSNLLPDFTSKLLILTGESTDIQTKSKTVALQTDEIDLYPKMEGLTSTSELKTKTSEPSYDMLTSPVSIENKENYFSVNETWQEASQFIDSTLPYPSPEKNPDGSICQDDRAIRRRGTFTLKESPLVAERNIIKYPEEQISLEKTEKKSKLRRETILLSSPLTEMKSISKDSSFQNNSPVQRVGNTKPSLYMKARISLSNQVTSYNRQNATSSLNRSQELSQNHFINRPDKMPKSYQNHSKILQKTTNDTSVNRLSKVSIINDKCGTTVTSGLKPPNSLSKSNKCGSSTLPVPSCLSLPRRSGLPKATTSIKHLSVGQASNTKIRGNSNSLKLSTKKSVVGPRENKMNQNLAKTGVNKTLETKKCAPLKATAPINLMIKSNIRDIRGSNHTVGSPRRDASITQRSSSFISTGQHTPSRRSFDISLSTPTLTSTPSTPKPFRSSVLGTPFSNDKGKVVRRRSGLPAPSWLHHPKTIDI